MTHGKTKSDAVGEFDVINRFFSHVGKPAGNHILLGVGDDAAMVSCGSEALVLTVDTLVSGVHFYPDDPPESIAHKALAVNLSDLSAMGAVPFAFLLSLTLPEAHEAWLERFSSTLHAQALKAHVSLIGGDTTRGPLSVSITALGKVNPDSALKRDAAKPGDDIYVTGELGLAAFHVFAQAQNKPSTALAQQAYQFPQPPLTFGPQLCGVAHAAIDVSDGLLADLSHILRASHVGARLIRANLPIAVEWQSVPPDQAFEQAMTGGDDYGLCFTAPKSSAETLKALSKTAGVQLSLIGEIVEGSGLTIEGEVWEGKGFQHFL